MSLDFTPQDPSAVNVLSVAKLQKEAMELQLNSTIRKKLSKLKMK